MTTFEEVKKQLPVVFDVSGLPRATAAAKAKIEKLNPGDEVQIKVDVPSAYSRYNDNVELDVCIEGSSTGGYLFGTFNYDWNLPMEAIAENIDKLVFTVEEMIPQSERTKRAKSPKLTIRVDAAE